ncbi:glycosyltransferase family 4 protein [Nocardioides sp.]|uniref:glycosyltransferase family 4 protein n=1 Tax=Nocardioides sp. TaxID=35761 RepID=UPI00356479E3
MKILHVNKFLYRRGGAESYMLDLAEIQRRQGDEVSFFSMEHPENRTDANADTFAPRMELNPPPETLGGRLATAAGVLYRRSARRGMEEVLDRVRPDVVHLHNIYHQLSPSVLRPLAARRIPAVMTLHDYKLACPTYQFLDQGTICESCLGRRFHQAVVRRCNQGSLSGSLLAATELSAHTLLGAYSPVDVFICPSEFMARKMTEGKVFPDRLVHVPHFCDLSTVSVATAPGSGVLYAGRLSHEKGVDVLLEAFTRIPEDISLTIAGGGPDRELLERRAGELGLAERVRFVGHVPGPQLQDLMRAAALVVVPSRWYENQPMTVLEAFGCGRPVVASDLGGLPELIDEGRTGYLVPHDEPAALAGALRSLAGNPRLAHAMGQDARAEATERFSVSAHLRHLRESYDRALRSKGQHERNNKGVGSWA